MEQKIQKVVIIGGGSAGFLSALTLKIKNPQLHIILIQSATIPIIGVGEATTNYLPRFLHNYLGLDRREFYNETKATWKLGIRFEWGPPKFTHFNYPFGDHLTARPKDMRKIAAYYCLNNMSTASVTSARMDLGRAPILRTKEGNYRFDENIGYHIENHSFVLYLERKSLQLGVAVMNKQVVQANQTESGHIRDLRLHDGSTVEADLFIDCSGFQSLLLGGILKEEYISFSDSLFCDSAVTGTWKRTCPVLPYTTAETMNHGWCWGIELIDRVNRGYVFSSSFCDKEEAIKEMKEKNPLMENEFKAIKFKSGRYKNFWVKNVAAIGNSGGFVEPLQSTGLHMICQAASLVAEALVETDGRPSPFIKRMANETWARIWDDLRWFIAVHYKYNTKISSPFWESCHRYTDVSGVQNVIDGYKESGPSYLLQNIIDPLSIFKLNGYLTVLIGQKVQTNFAGTPSEEELTLWQTYQTEILQRAKDSLSMEEAFKLLDRPDWRWPKGI